MLNPTHTSLARAIYSRANQINHIFNESEHKLDVVVKACSNNKGKVLDNLIDAYSKAARGRDDGFFETVVSIDGQSVTVRGTAVGGAAKVSTAFIP